MGQHLRESHRAAPPVVNNIVTDDSREANGHNHMNKIQESIESPDLSKAQVTRLPGGTASPRKHDTHVGMCCWTAQGTTVVNVDTHVGWAVLQNPQT